VLNYVARGDAEKYGVGRARIFNLAKTSLKKETSDLV
jgi:hypothetical protein